jgi:ERF superfamily protein
MNKSESIINLSKALLKAQKVMGGAVKDSKNPFFKSTYSDYGSVLEVVKGPLNENGILVLQPHVNDPGQPYVETILIHAESGEFLSSCTPVVCAKANDPQAMGSAITYARRYGLQSLLSIPSEDDDGNAGSGKTGVSAMPKAATVTPISAPSPEYKQGKAAEAEPGPSKSSFRKLGAATVAAAPAPAASDLDL